MYFGCLNYQIFTSYQSLYHNRCPHIPIMPAGTSLSHRGGTELPTSTIIFFLVMTLICTKDDPFQEDRVKASGICQGQGGPPPQRHGAERWEKWLQESVFLSAALPSPSRHLTTQPYTQGPMKNKILESEQLNSCCVCSALQCKGLRSSQGSDWKNPTGKRRWPSDSPSPCQMGQRKLHFRWRCFLAV